MPAGIVVTGGVCAAALVQPAPVNVTGLESAAATPAAAQLGGTDNPPSEDAWPTPATTGAELAPAATAGAGGLVGMNGAPAAAGSIVGSQLTAPGRN